MGQRGWQKSPGDDKRRRNSSLGLQGNGPARKAENKGKNTIVKNLDSGWKRLLGGTEVREQQRARTPSSALGSLSLWRYGEHARMAAV